MAVDLISSIVDRANVSKQLGDTNSELQETFKLLTDNIQAANQLNAVLGRSTGQRQFQQAQDQLQRSVERGNQSLDRARLAALKLQQQQDRNAITANQLASSNLRLQQQQDKAAQSAAKQATEYQKLVKAYNEATAAAREAGVVHGVQSRQFADEAANVQRLRGQLDSIDQPLGNFQRNVGNYASGVAGAFSKLYGYIRVAANIIPGLGISGIFLAAFDGIKYVVEQLGLFNNQLSQTEANIKAFNEVNKDADQQAGKQIVNLKILYQAATDVTNSTKDRTAAARELQKEFPDYFKNIKLETILNGGASDSYKELSANILETAKAQAVASKLAKIQTEILDVEEEKQKHRNANADVRAKEALSVRKRIADALAFEAKRSGRPAPTEADITTSVNNSIATQDDDVIKRSDKLAADAIRDLDNKKKVLQASADFLIKYAGGNNKIAKAISEGNEPTTKNTALDVLNNQLEQAKNIRDRILQDENSSYDDRLKALYTYEHDTENLILAAENRKTITRLDAGNRAAEIEQDSDKKRLELAKAAQKELQELAKDQLEFQKDYNKQIQTVAEDLNTKATTKLLDEAQDSANEQLAILADQYKRGEITTQQYNDRKAEIERQANLNSQALTIAGLEQLIEIRKMFGLNEADDERKLADLKRKLSKDTLSAQLADLDKLNAEKKKGRDAEKTAAKALGDELLTLGKTLVDAQFTNQLNAIQAQKDALDDQTSAQIDAINREVGSNADKADKIAIINAKAAAQQKQLDQQARKIKHDQAVADKAFAIATIIENTAIGVSKALAEYIFPYSAIVAGLVGALGAAQIATVLATPVPAYADGTEFHPGGLARIGEAGKELVIEPGKSPWMTNGDVTRPLARGTQVISNRELIAATMSLGTVRDRENIPWGELIGAVKDSKANVNVKPRVSGWLAEQRKAERFNNYRKNHFN